MASPSAPVAVFTGDLIKSSSLSTDELRKARDCVVETFREMATWSSEPVVAGDAEFFRGDSWQAALVAPQFALRAAFFLRASLRSQGLTDSRIAIGLSGVDSLHADRVSLSSGEAFLLSGHSLDSLSKQVDLTIALAPSADATLATWLPIVMRLCDSLISGWTSRQAEVVSHLLFPEKTTHQTVAERLGVSRPTVSGALETAHWGALEEVLETFESNHQFGSPSSLQSGM